MSYQRCLVHDYTSFVSVDVLEDIITKSEGPYLPDGAVQIVYFAVVAGLPTKISNFCHGSAWNRYAPTKKISP